MNIEKIGLWDRFFNRYRKEVIKQGVETWHKSYGAGAYPAIMGQAIPNSGFDRDFVIYRIIDRVTGSEEIKKEYLN